MGRNGTVKKKRSWSHQTDAVECVERYLKDVLSEPRFAAGSDSRAALVRMPTGTGKSGVIAMLCQSPRRTGSVLVLTPATMLAEQLGNDIESRFWSHAGKSPPKDAKTVVRAYPKTLAGCLEECKRTPRVVTSTLQTLEAVAREDKALYRALGDTVELVLVDEGHREPAVEWGAAVRGLRRPTVLFSATPYRNDHRVFNVDRDHTFAYTHEEAEKDFYVRHVKFEEVEFADTPEAFVEALLQFYDSRRFQSRIPGHVIAPRVIVRCDNAGSVRRVAEELDRRERSVLAFHEDFKNTGYFRNQPPVDRDDEPNHTPDPAENAVFWVHQWKLVEGVDREDFCLLAVFEPMGNARSFVQQVGRIIRNRRGLPDQHAHVLVNPRHRQRPFWDLYRKHEKNFERNPDLYEKRSLYELSVAITPEVWHYEDRSYRSRFDLEAVNLHTKLLYPLAANVFELAASHSPEEMGRSVIEELEQMGHDCRLTKPASIGRDTSFVPFVCFHNSPLLAEHYLFLFDLGFALWRKAGDHLLWVSSLRWIPEHLGEHARLLDPRRLRRLFRESTRNRLTQVSLLNADLGTHSVRRRTVGARSIGALAPALHDHLQVCSTAQGVVQRGGNPPRSRYVGFTRSRISDHSHVRGDYEALSDWLNEVAAELDQPSEAMHVFERFAAFVSPPRNPAPANILLDIEDEAAEFRESATRLKRLGRATSDPARPFDVEDVCMNVNEKGSCTLTLSEELAAGDPEPGFPLSVSYEPAKKRYELACSKLDDDFIRVDSEGRKHRSSLCAVLTRQQSFRVIPKSTSVVYAHGRFYEPRVDLVGKSSSKGKLTLHRMLCADPELTGITSEKGEACQARGAGWQKGSLFALLDSPPVPGSVGVRGALAGREWLVCDDMDRESADFIALWRDRVAYIHAKAFGKDTPRVRSASAFHEVSAQAIKNLGYLSPFGKTSSRRAERWRRVWKAPKVRGSVRERIRAGTGGADEFMKAHSLLVADPSCRREVWIVIGDGFSLGAFDLERMKEEPLPEIVQIAYLLQTTWSAANEIGAALRVFCSE